MNGSPNSLQLPPRPFWVRLIHTPLGDLVRLRVSGRFDVKGLLVASGLPKPIQKAILEVVRRTRLRRSEQMEVARELIGRFGDDLGAGETPEGLVERFGKLRKAARRIRREKIRARPLGWRIFRRVVQGAAWSLVVLVVWYVGLWARFFLGRPTVSWNYMAELNAEAKAIPEAQRAWPLYRAALLKLEPIPEGITVPEDYGSASQGERPEGVEAKAEPGRRRPIKPHEFLSTEPGDEHWGARVAYLEQIEEALDLTRQAAARPRLGFYYNDPADAVDCPVDWDGSWHKTIVPPVWEENPEVSEMHLGHLDRMRTLRQLLRADALRAAEGGDGNTAAADLVAMFGMADHCRDTGHSPVCDLIGISVMNMAFDTLGRIVADRPDSLSNEQLDELARRVTAIAEGGRVRVRADGERAWQRDVLQRSYTDDGRGDGYLTYQAAHHFPHIQDRLDDIPWRDQSGSVLDFFLMPVAVAGRRQISEFCDQILDELDEEGNRPLWEQRESAAKEKLNELSKSVWGRVRYLPALLVFPSLESAKVGGELATQRRDATLVVIALEQFRRRHGKWPERLEQLVPDLLPTVPPDRFDGKSLKYRIVDGRPVVYSIGVDRYDDGGVPPEDPYACPFIWEPPSRAAEIRAEGSRSGDWVLWPPAQWGP